MNAIERTKKDNKLAAELGLYDKSPVDEFYENPTARTFKKIPKMKQTYEMIKFAVMHDGRAIKSASKRLVTYELYELAVKQNGLALFYVTEDWRSKKLCEVAVKSNGLALEYVPKEYITKEFCELAVENNGMAIKYVPPEFNIKELRKTAVMQNGLALGEIYKKNRTKELCEMAFENTELSIQYIPEKWITPYIALKAVCYPMENKYASQDYPVCFIPEKILTWEMVVESVKHSPYSIKNIPEKFYKQELFSIAFDADPFTFMLIPEKYITTDMCLKVIDASYDEEKEKRISLYFFPNKMLNQKVVIDALIQKIGPRRIILWNDRLKTRIENGEQLDEKTQPLSEKTISYIQSIIDVDNVTSDSANNVTSVPVINAITVATPPASSDTTLLNRYEHTPYIYNLSNSNDGRLTTIYYITDIHLEHQLQSIFTEYEKDFQKIDDFITFKIKEMLTGIENKYGILLIGGDVAHTKKLTELFYRKLVEHWNGRIISVLGNHELWDYSSNISPQNLVPRTVDEITNYYRNIINVSCLFGGKSTLLNNEMFITYKNGYYKTIKEEQILNASDDDLKDLCSNSELVLLGGVGFSGLNPYYNALKGLYRSTVTTLEEDKRLSERFCSIYNKLNRCAGDKQIIVFTHMPVHDWTNETCNPNWIYINGHTHQNSLVREHDGTTVLSDNQVGYTPSKWKLNGFSVSGWYDPFKDTPNGIYEISSEMYMEFNKGRGISSNGCNYLGKIYMLKRNSLYMFLLESDSSLCLLAGGQRKRLKNNDLQYYYDNMEIYHNKVIKAIMPFQSTLQKVSKEVKLIGGWGYVHGCIVDIDYFNHIYVNPYDGKMTPYWALNMTFKYTYDDLPALLKARIPELNKKFIDMANSGNIPILNQYAVLKKKKKASEKMTLAVVPELVLGTEMYEPSRVMRSIQYIFNSNVIRIWKDEILTMDLNEQEKLVEFDR